MKTQAFKVFLGRKQIDTVFYSNKDTREDVRQSLINHDGYDPNIRVVKERPKPTQPVTEYTDTDKDRIGQQIAALLDLKRDREHRDRYATTWGTKTNQGIFEVIRRIGRAIEAGTVEEDLK